MLEVWRIVTPQWAKGAFSGEGAKISGGRWNREGTTMVYTAGSLALAAMEMLVHLESEHVLANYLAIPARLPEKLVESIAPAKLPEDWRSDPIPPATQTLGSEWVQSLRSAILAVPSIIIPQEKNYLLNPVHPEFGGIEIGEPEPFDYDSRLLKPA